ncbi:hypothetical protein ACLKA6_018050 [Drosophila palustris]
MNARAYQIPRCQRKITLCAIICPWRLGTGDWSLVEAPSPSGSSSISEEDRDRDSFSSLSFPKVPAANAMQCRRVS